MYLVHLTSFCGPDTFCKQWLIVEVWNHEVSDAVPGDCSMSSNITHMFVRRWSAGPQQNNTEGEPLLIKSPAYDACYVQTLISDESCIRLAPVLAPVSETSRLIDPYSQKDVHIYQTMSCSVGCMELDLQVVCIQTIIRVLRVSSEFQPVGRAYIVCALK